MCNCLHSGEENVLEISCCKVLRTAVTCLGLQCTWVTWEKSFNLIPLHFIFFSFLNSILETPEVKKHMYAGTTHACQNTRWLDYEIEKLSTHSTLSRATCWALLYAYLQIFHLCSTVCTTWRLRRFFDILDFPLRCTSLRSQLSDTWMYLVWQTSDPSPNDSACFDTLLLLLHCTVFFTPTIL